MNTYRFRRCTPEDEPALIDLFDLVFGQRRSTAQWRWKFAPRPGTHAYSMVALDGRDTIVAHAGALELPGWYDGKPFPCVQICDVMVHPDHRGGMGRNNLFTLLLRTLLASIHDTLPDSFRYGFPGQGPYLVGERAGVYRRIETAIETVLATEAPRFTLWRTVPLAWNDARLDRLWVRLRDEHALSLVRDAAYLGWRYADNPFHTYRLFGLRRMGQLVGWLVVRPDGERLLIVDALLPRRHVASALAAATLRQHWPDTRSVHLWLPPAWRAGVAGQSVETPVVTANMSWQCAVDTDRARQALYYTMGDVDIF